MTDEGMLTWLLSHHMSFNLAQKLSNELLAKYGDLYSLINTKLELLVKDNRINEQVAMHIHLLGEISKIIIKERTKRIPIIEAIPVLKDYCKTIINNNECEEFHTVFLNSAGYIIGTECIDVGIINQVAPFQRDIMTRALKHNARYVVFVHNHPNGNKHPSHQDISFTNQLKVILNQCQVIVFDHIIIANSEAFSFKEEGLIKTGYIYDGE